MSEDSTQEQGEPIEVRPDIRAAIEAVLLAAVDSVEPQLLAQLLEIAVAEVEATCEAMTLAYQEEGRGFTIARVAGGYRFQTHPDQVAYVERFVLEGQSARLSPSALETLAIVAYKQPASKAQVSSIRGVNVDSTLSTLEQRGYVIAVGQDSGPGQAILYGTTRLFLERMGLNSIADLPTLSEFVPGAEVVEALERGLRISPASIQSEIVSAIDEPADVEGITDSAPANSDS
ncbi:MAG: SMC-Scp complex subunit ScpB [Actinomycetes bacterium]